MSGTPSGSNGYVQFKDGDIFGSDTNLFWDNSYKQLGIGTISPGAKLEVQQTDTTQAYSVKIGTSTTAYHVVVSTSGNVGIGTTQPDQKLTIAGTIGILEGGDSPTYYTIFKGGDQGENITYTLPVSAGSSGQVLTTDGSGILSWTTAESLPSGESGQTLRHNGTEWVANDFLFNNGTNIGIGTTNPNSKLEVNGMVKATIFNGSGSQLSDVILLQDTLQSGATFYVSSGTVDIFKVGTSISLPEHSIADTALSTNVSLLGQSIESSEITDETIVTEDIANGAVTDTKVTLTTGAISSGVFDDSRVSITTAAVLNIESLYVNNAGDTMTGQLTLADSTLTVTGNAFSVGVSTLVVKDGNVGIGTTSPGAKLEVQQTDITQAYSVKIGTSTSAYHVVVSTLGNVGIGTTQPTQKLHVAGKLQIGDDGTADTAGAIRWTGTNFEGYTGTSWKKLDIESSSVGGGWTEDETNNKVYVTNTGRDVGIGTTNPTSKFTVFNGDIQFSTTTGDRGIIFQDGTKLTTALGGIAGGVSNKEDAIILADSDKLLGGDVLIKTGTNLLGPYTRLIVKNDGNIGIGTTQPESKLDVAGTAQLRGAAGVTGLYVDSSGNVGVGTTKPEHKLAIANGETLIKTYTYGLETTVNTGGGWARSMRIRNEKDNVTVAFGSVNGDAYIATAINVAIDPTGYQSQKLTVLKNGNVGVGTSVPGAKLEVAGAAPGSGINIKTNDIVLNDKASLFFNGNYSYASGSYIRPVGANTQAFFTAGAERMRITSTGNVGIGTTNPQTKLAVVGITGSTAGRFMKYLPDGTGRIFYYSSSKKYKDDIQPFHDDFNKIFKVEPKSFIDKVTGERCIGYIAEEFDALGLKKLVGYKDGEPDTINYELISLYLVEIVKNQQRQIDELKAQLNNGKIGVGRMGPSY